jgi:hypothetical protein
MTGAEPAPTGYANSVSPSGRGHVPLSDQRLRVADDAGQFDQHPQVDRPHDERLGLVGRRPKANRPDAIVLQDRSSNSLVKGGDGRKRRAVGGYLDFAARKFTAAVDPRKHLDRVNLSDLRERQ